MIEKLGENLVKSKQEFAKMYHGTSHIQEIIPLKSSDQFPLDENHLEALHKFAKNNPIYYNSYNETIVDTEFTVYEGDINEYWLNSIKHSSSTQPFYPTWILSAYIISYMAKSLGYTESVDIGSGDGRIAYCSKILGLEAHSIEIDDTLVGLQDDIIQSTGVNFKPNCFDAVTFDYSALNLTRPAFFIGGLAQMGGDILASGIIEKINLSNIKDNTAMVFAGTYAKKYLSANLSHGGWSNILNQYSMQVNKTILLPTVWTFDQLDDTPYIFAHF